MFYYFEDLSIMPGIVSSYLSPVWTLPLLLLKVIYSNITSLHDAIMFLF